MTNMIKAYSCDSQWVCINSRIIAKEVRKDCTHNSHIYFFMKWVERFMSEITLVRLCHTRVAFIKIIM